MHPRSYQAVVFPVLLMALAFSAATPAQPAAKANESKGPAKKTAAWPPKDGVKTPGVQIPITLLKADAEIQTGGAPDSFLFAGDVLIPDKARGWIVRVDGKANKVTEPWKDFGNPCGGAVNAFRSLWFPDCGAGTVVRADPKRGSVTARVASGVAVARPALAATSDSIWVLADQKTTLARIDPEANQVVAETRLPAGCTSLIAAESAIWVTCPSEPKLLRVDPNTNLVSNRIEVAEGPISVAAGEGSIWVLSKTAGKVSRIDPKTNKVSATIPLEIPNAQGSMVFGEGSLWISVPGFPISRISPQTEKVIQQFAGEGDGILQTGLASLWLADPVRGRVLRFDPKRIAATLSE